MTRETAVPLRFGDEELEGVLVARRTVAKYREALGIPPSSERKKVPVRSQ